MSWLSVLLALLPVTVIFSLLALHRTAADVAGLVGWGMVVAVVWPASFHRPSCRMPRPALTASARRRR
jgi:L-lactate permease